MKRKSSQVGYKTVGFKPSKVLVIVLLSLLIIFSSFLGYLYFGSLSSYTFKENAVYYVNGISFDIIKGDKAVLKNKEFVNIETKDGFDFNTDSLPVYFKDKDSVLIIKPMSIFPKGMSSYTRGNKLDYFITVGIDNNSVIVSKKARKVSESMSFMFDGEDTFVIFDYATLSIGDNKIKLSPLSYVISVYDTYVLYYDYEKDLFVDFSFEKDDPYMPVELEFNDGVTVHCDIDRVTAGLENFMLTSAIKTLPKLI